MEDGEEFGSIWHGGQCSVQDMLNSTHKYGSFGKEDGIISLQNRTVDQSRTSYQFGQS